MCVLYGCDYSSQATHDNSKEHSSFSVLLCDIAVCAVSRIRYTFATLYGTQMIAKDKNKETEKGREWERDGVCECTLAQKSDTKVAWCDSMHTEATRNNRRRRRLRRRRHSQLIVRGQKMKKIKKRIQIKNDCDPIIVGADVWCVCVYVSILLFS